MDFNNASLADKVRKRTAGGLATTKFGNELADAIGKLGPVLNHGNAEHKPPWPQPALVWVDLTQTGGSAGDASTECSFTYTIKLHGQSATLAEDVELAGHRFVKAAYTAGTIGIAATDTDGTWVLLWTDERAATTTPCD